MTSISFILESNKNEGFVAQYVHRNHSRALPSEHMDGSENMEEKEKNGNGVSDAFNLIDASALSKVKDMQKLNDIV